MVRYAISDGSAAYLHADWIGRVRRWLEDGLDYIQIREKSLSARELALLTKEVMALPNPHGTKILVNDRTDLALACGAHGVHLRDGSVAPAKLRPILPPGFLVAVSCHEEAGIRGVEGADFLVAAPVFRPFSKDDQRATLGLPGLARLVRAAALPMRIPVLALGGVTEENAPLCVQAGAAGIAGITLFKR